MTKTKKKIDYHPRKVSEEVMETVRVKSAGNRAIRTWGKTTQIPLTVDAKSEDTTRFSGVEFQLRPTTTFAET